MALKHLLAGVAVIGLMAQPALAQNQNPTKQQQPAAQASQPDIKCSSNSRASSPSSAPRA